MSSTVSVRVQEPVRAKPPVPPAPRDRSRRAWILAGFLVIAALLAGALAWMRWSAPSRPAVASPATLFAPVARANFVRSVRVGGTVAAVRYSAITAPAMRGGPGFGGGGQITITNMIEPGTRVKKGQILAEFDRQQQLNSFQDREAEYISLTDQIAKRRAELDIERERQLTDLQKARAEVDAARLENQRNEVISRIDAEKNQQLLAEAQATLKMLEQTLKLRQQAAEAEIRLLEIRRERERLQMEHARINYERMVVASPIEGMVVLTPFWKGGQMGTAQVGDQVRSGTMFLQVVDASQMLVRARTNQLDAALLQHSGPVEVRLDAYPELKFSGKVESVAALAQGSPWGRNVKVFPAVFTVEGSEPRLMPDVSASVDVVLEEVPEALVVPRGSVVRQAASAGEGFVWVKQGDATRARTVKLGPHNEIHYVVREGLREGEQVALFPPREEQAGRTPGAPGGADGQRDTR